MKGGFLIALNDELYARAAGKLVELGGLVAEDDGGGVVVQLVDDLGRRFMLYERVPDGTEWEVTEGSFKVAPDVTAPDMRGVTACPFECRWPEMVASLAGAIARAAGVLTWVLDGDGVIWNAESVDPSNVKL
jgi:hypothetical protein